MQRRWQVHPDETGTVSREALINAFIDAAALLDLAGGYVKVLVGRQPTGFPGEMVTTGAAFEWGDRTDAKAQMEQPSNIGTAPQPEPEPEPDPLVEALADVRPAPSDDNPDGFDYSKLQDEDVEAESVR